MNRFWLSVPPLIAAVAACAQPSLPPPPAAAPVAASVPVAGQAAFSFEGPMIQGGLVRGTAPAGTARLTLGDVPVEFGADGRFLIGFDRDHAAVATLKAELADGRVMRRGLADRAARVADRACQYRATSGWAHRRLSQAARNRAGADRPRPRGPCDQQRLAPAVRLAGAGPDQRRVRIAAHLSRRARRFSQRRRHRAGRGRAGRRARRRNRRARRPARVQPRRQSGDHRPRHGAQQRLPPPRDQRGEGGRRSSARASRSARSAQPGARPGRTCTGA